MVVLRNEIGLLRAERENLMKMNSKLMAQQPQGTTTPRAGSTSNHSWIVTGISPQTTEGEEAETQRRKQEMDDIKDELNQARADVDRLRDDRNASIE